MHLSRYVQPGTGHSLTELKLRCFPWLDCICPFFLPSPFARATAHNRTELNTCQYVRYMPNTYKTQLTRSIPYNGLSYIQVAMEGHPAVNGYYDCPDAKLHYTATALRSGSALTRPRVASMLVCIDQATKRHQRLGELMPLPSGSSRYRLVRTANSISETLLLSARRP